MSNANLGAAKAAKNDEFYTQYGDIEAEMNAYYEFDKNVFKDKTILCPCDDPEWSNFTRYFASNFERFGLKKLISTSYAKSAGSRKATAFETSSPLYDPDKHGVCGKVFVLEGDKDGNKHVDVDDIRFQGYLNGDGDFRSEEVTKLRDEADIIVTNPPFSLFREFLKWIRDGKKQFVIVGNKNAITYKEVFPLLKDNEMWLGPGFPEGNAYFRIAKDTVREFASGVYDESTGLVKFRNVGWFTNIDHGLRHTILKLDTMAHNLKFNKKLKRKFENAYGDVSKYPHYDNYDAIEVPFTECIPSDYDGVMGVPISFMDKYNPDQFEILGMDGNDYADELGIKEIGEKWVRMYRTAGGTGHITANMHSLVLIGNGAGITVYKRILIRKRPPEPVPEQAQDN